MVIFTESLNSNKKRKLVKEGHPREKEQHPLPGTVYRVFWREGTRQHPVMEAQRRSLIILCSYPCFVSYWLCGLENAPSFCVSFFFTLKWR